MKHAMKPYRTLLIGASIMLALAYYGAAQAADTSSKSSRQKKLNFDGDYVETMGKNPLDSLTALSEAQKNRNSHLYRKRADFAPGKHGNSSANEV